LPLATLRLCGQGDHALIAPKKINPTGPLLEDAMDCAESWMAVRGSSAMTD
jgi:hypothetical protein